MLPSSPASDLRLGVDFDVVALEHPNGILSLIAFRQIPAALQQTYLRRLLGTFARGGRPHVVDVAVSSLSEEIIRRIQRSFSERGGDMVVCAAKRREPEIVQLPAPARQRAGRPLAG